MKKKGRGSLKDVKNWKSIKQVESGLKRLITNKKEIRNFKYKKTR